MLRGAVGARGKGAARWSSGLSRVSEAIQGELAAIQVCPLHLVLVDDQRKKGADTRRPERTRASA